jgi:hypothetical protein
VRGGIDQIPPDQSVAGRSVEKPACKPSNGSADLKIRMLAHIEDRVKLEMERERITEEKARNSFKKDDY